MSQTQIPAECPSCGLADWVNPNTDCCWACGREKVLTIPAEVIPELVKFLTTEDRVECVTDDGGFSDLYLDISGSCNPFDPGREWPLLRKNLTTALEAFNRRNDGSNKDS